MEKVDVAIQSYNKPESLIYTCFTLKEFCGKHIDKIFINDDISEKDTMEILQSDKFKEAMFPIKIVFRRNEKKAGLFFCTWGMMRRPENWLWYIYDLIKKRHPVIIEKNDIRYQYAIENTDKKFLFITHDDVEFRGDIIGLYLDQMEDNYAIVGDLGQCWRCPCKDICSPRKIVSGYRPTKFWPITSIFQLKKRRACRINEWSCLIDANIAKEISKKKNIYFGAYESLGDIGAYYFAHVVRNKMKFFDPLTNGKKDLYYKHCWQGFAGNSVEMHGGRNKYDAKMIKELIFKKYGFEF